MINDGYLSWIHTAENVVAYRVACKLSLLDCY